MFSDYKQVTENTDGYLTHLL